MRLFFLGITITLLSWIISWGKFNTLSQYMFFPLWLGYILTINGLSFLLVGKSLLSKTGIYFILFFLISAPFWWLFESLNLLTKNWNYILSSTTNRLEYFIIATFYFSIVVPAILSTSFLFYQIIIKVKDFSTRPFPITAITLLILLELAALSFLLIFLFPQFSFPLLWGGLFFLFEPINHLFKFPTLILEISKGRWSKIIAIMIASLFTGFWWELWNYYSLPKWTYNVPFVGFFKVFEMPILGYIGYPFFGLELYSFTNFSLGILEKLKIVPRKLISQILF